MDSNKADVVMKFVLNGNPVPAECSLDIAQGDTLMTDFSNASGEKIATTSTTSSAARFANFFEVTGFNFGISLKENDDSAQAATSPAPGAFPRWRSASQQDYKSISYPLEFDHFSFDRVIDSASPIFFQSCCTSQTFDSVALVKRVSAGEGNTPVSFLRLDFTKVLITGISWNDGDVVTESCEFICQTMKVTYRKQSASGAIASGTGNQFSAIWPNPNKDRSRGIRSGR